MRPERIAEVGDLSVWRPGQRDLTGLTSSAGACAATEADARRGLRVNECLLATLQISTSEI
jgi:hypothetical protein